MALRPASLPKAGKRLVSSLFDTQWADHGHEDDPPLVRCLAVRGYRHASMGDPRRNDVGIFDDAMFFFGPGLWLPENANTDPSRYGWNEAIGKPYAQLESGVWFFYPGPHRGHMPSFRQADDKAVGRRFKMPLDGAFTVRRMWGHEDPRNATMTGWYQINIHRAVMNSTSSWGCLTLPFDRSDKALGLVVRTMREIGQKTLPVALMEGPIV